MKLGSLALALLAITGMAMATSGCGKNEGQKLADEGNGIQDQEIQSAQKLNDDYQINLVTDSSRSITWRTYSADQRSDILGRLKTYVSNGSRYIEITHNSAVAMKDGRSNTFIPLTMDNAKDILESLEAWMDAHPTAR